MSAFLKKPYFKINNPHLPLKLLKISSADIPSSGLPREQKRMAEGRKSTIFMPLINILKLRGSFSANRFDLFYMAREEGSQLRINLLLGELPRKPAQRAYGVGTEVQSRYTDQRGSAGAPAERLVEGRASKLQLFQVAVGNSDIGRQGQALVQVLEGQ